MGTKALVMFHILKGVCVTQVHTFLKIGKCTLNFIVRYLPQEKKNGVNSGGNWNGRREGIMGMRNKQNNQSLETK